MKIQLVSFPGCPSLALTRSRLRSVLVELGRGASIDEVDTTAPDCHPALKRWGSPTILINGEDVEGAEPQGASCRLYWCREGPSGAPTAEVLRNALLRHLAAEPSEPHRQGPAR